MEIRRYPSLLEINTRTWLNKLCRVYDRELKLRDIPDEVWNEVLLPGIDSVWLMGVYKLSPGSRELAYKAQDLHDEYRFALPDITHEDIVGSPYAIHEYDINPVLGTWEDVDIVREMLNKRGISLILDFVPNHTACDHPWTVEHPEYYVRGEKNILKSVTKEMSTSQKNPKQFIANGKDPFFAGWMDTAQLNYFAPETRKIMTETLLNIASHADGVRCDMAMLALNDVHASIWGPVFQAQGIHRPPSEFWSDAIATVKSEFEDFIFIAEVYWRRDRELSNLGFDFTYDKELYDLFLKGSGNNVREHILGKGKHIEQMVVFLENHDERRAAKMLPVDRQKAAAVIMAFLPVLKLYYLGQFTGKKKKVPVQLGREPEEEINQELKGFYANLMSVVDEEIFHRGNWELGFVSKIKDKSQVHDKIVAFKWSLVDEEVIVAVNFTNQKASGHVQGLKFEQSEKTRFEELLSNAEYEYTNSDLEKFGFYLKLDPYGFQVFRVKL